MKGRAPVVVVAAAVTFLSIGAASSPAFASHGHPVSAPGTVTCTLSGTIKFSPSASIFHGYGNPAKVKARLTGCHASSVSVDSISGVLTGSFVHVPYDCTTQAPFCSGSDPSASLRVKWTGVYGGRAAHFTDSTIADTGSAAVTDAAGDVGFYVPGVDNTSVVTGSFTSNGSYLDIFTTETLNQIKSAETSRAGLKKLTVTGTLTLRDITAYVADQGSSTVLPIETATTSEGASIPVGHNIGSVGGIAVTPDGATVYVANSGDNTVTPINTATNTPGTPISVGLDPQGIAITPNGATVYVVDADQVTPISTATNTAGTPIPVGHGPYGIAITPNGATAYVANSVDNTVTPINTATDTAGAPIFVGHDPVLIAITPDGATAYVANHFDNTVTPISTATNTAGTPIPVGSGPAAIAVTPDGSTAYVTNAFAASVTPISTATNTAGTPIPVGSGPIALAITPDGSTAYVPNYDDNTVTLIDTATNTAGSPLAAGTTPDGVAIG